MTSARHHFQFALVLALVGLGVAAGALIAGLSRASFSLPPLSALLEACRGLVAPLHQGASLLTLVLIGVGAMVIVMTLRSIVSHLGARKRFLAPRAEGADAVIRELSYTRFESALPEAFCAGFLHPAIYVSTRAIERLSAQELYAVVCHEDFHRRRRDPLRIFLLGVWADSLPFLPALARMADRHRALAELAADEFAARRAGRRELASALLHFGGVEGSAAVVGIAPERVDQLLGVRPRLELPVALLSASGVIVGILAVLASTLPALAPAGGVSILLALAHSCMTLMFLAAGLLLGAVVVHTTRRWSSRSRVGRSARQPTTGI